MVNFFVLQEEVGRLRKFIVYTEPRKLIVLFKQGINRFLKTKIFFSASTSDLLKTINLLYWKIPQTIISLE